MPRPRGFDEEQIIDRAMELFWTKGYEATSVSDLTEELGVHPGSLYRTFGDKHALFLRALTRYRDSQARALAPALLAGGPVLPRIRAALVGFIELAAEQDKPRGCLAANTVGELLPGDLEVASGVAGVLSDVEDGFLQGLRLAARQGEIPDTLDLPGWAATLTMLVQGLQVVAKADPDPRRLVSGVDAALLALAAMRDGATRGPGNLAGGEGVDGTGAAVRCAWPGARLARRHRAGSWRSSAAGGPRGAAAGRGSPGVAGRAGRRVVGARAAEGRRGHGAYLRVAAPSLPEGSMPGCLRAGRTARDGRVRGRRVRAAAAVGGA